MLERNIAEGLVSIIAAGIIVSSLAKTILSNLQKGKIGVALKQGGAAFFLITLFVFGAIFWWQLGRSITSPGDVQPAATPSPSPTPASDVARGRGQGPKNGRRSGLGMGRIPVIRAGSGTQTPAARPTPTPVLLAEQTAQPAALQERQPATQPQPTPQPTAQPTPPESRPATPTTHLTPCAADKPSAQFQPGKPGG